jgi:hypothetical protein
MKAPKEDLPAIVVARTQNSKVGNAVVTHASQKSCPKDCPLLNKGCYAENSFQGWTTNRLNKAAKKYDILEIARIEAAAIRQLVADMQKPGKRKKQWKPMRIHAVGDSTTNEGTKILSDAIMEYMKAGNVKAWGYTHAHRVVDRVSWQDVSILASCETLEDAERAMQRGYAAAVIMAHPPDGKAFKVGDITVIPCVEQTHGRVCTDCKLCFNDKSLLERRAVIAFDPHGNRTNTVLQMLAEKRRRTNA